MGYSNGLLRHNVDDNLTGETSERDEKSQQLVSNLHLTATMIRRKRD